METSVLLYVLIGFIVIAVAFIAILVTDTERKHTMAITCPKCNGRGVDRKDELFNCSECDGTGLIIFVDHWDKSGFMKKDYACWWKW